MNKEQEFISIEDAIENRHHTTPYFYHPNIKKCSYVDDICGKNVELALVPVDTVWEEGPFELCTRYRQIYESTGVKLTAYHINIMGLDINYIDDIKEVLDTFSVNERVVLTSSLSIIEVLSALRSFSNVSIHLDFGDLSLIKYIGNHKLSLFDLGALRANFIVHSKRVGEKIFELNKDDLVASNVHRGRLIVSDDD